MHYLISFPPVIWQDALGNIEIRWVPDEECLIGYLLRGDRNSIGGPFGSQRYRCFRLGLTFSLAWPDNEKAAPIRAGPELPGFWAAGPSSPRHLADPTVSQYYSCHPSGASCQTFFATVSSDFRFFLGASCKITVFFSFFPFASLLLSAAMQSSLNFNSN